MAINNKKKNYNLRNKKKTMNNQKTHKLKQFKKKKTHKLPHIIVAEIPKFFQKDYSPKSENIINNAHKNLITAHKTYYPTQRRMIIIGDIHGDLDALIDCLILAKVIRLPSGVKAPEYKDRTDKVMYDFFHKLEWIGDDTFVIQLGDQIDRTRPVDWDENDVGIGKTINDEGSSLHIFFLMWYLNCIAKANGGRVISVLGNHEMMNVGGDFRYVSPFEFEEYYKAFMGYYKKQGEFHKNIENLKQNFNNNITIPKGYEERYQAFNRGELISNFFALNYKLVVQVGKWLFMHAGLTDNICGPSSICKINNAVSRHLLGLEKNDSDAGIYKRVINCSGERSPIWNREFGDCEGEDCLLDSKYNTLLKKFNETNKPYHTKNNIPEAEYVAIGHTPQFYANQNINSALNGKVWRCDVGMSRAFGSRSDNEYRKPQVLEVLNDVEINILS